MNNLLPGRLLACCSLDFTQHYGSKMLDKGVLWLFLGLFASVVKQNTSLAHFGSVHA